MKRLLALLLALVMLLSLAACAGEAKEDEKKDSHVISASQSRDHRMINT